MNAKYSPREAAGKFITVYPASIDSFHEAIKGLEKKLIKFEGPYVLSDYPCSNSSVIFARYGAFVRRYTAGPDGKMVGAVEDPQGNLVPDLRSVYPRTPDWAPRDKKIQKIIDEFESSSDKDLPFDIVSSLHFSNAGGVYRGLYQDCEVVIKEARAGAGFDEAGNDAPTRLRREYNAIRSLGDVSGVPEVIDYMTIWRHDYMVMKYIQGISLLDWFHDNFIRAKVRNKKPNRIHIIA
ncbi:hypothetical protein [Dermatophilus congolensis]|uniref:class III lanthionine synthetase LanKC N-terminal domain-containing protein n=1 Tax=Dermatophilus congolensis TaxID=1863 RepID=UPI001AAE4145|nr:hypothetical protein [Dermatophilus congolensis]MBO3130080.1 hypothetical protein [Dermatophilus congolensis]MBO3131293.1 hypothetical protein [Dermatophilus congolensis]MBO3134551.1 hypothetical protein [Dermatophilus congolensis]MBO3136788.1 hypothetical protein [Dermatophilus congolensis]MBO3139032.1 hypothetical protein [Dermatophilus congolensis]